MSIYGLKSDAWACISSYLDATDIIKLVFTGDSTLLTVLKPAIRALALQLETTTSPSLSSLMRLFKVYLSHLRRLSISLVFWYSRLRFVSEDHTAEKWKSFFPESLESLELFLACDTPPFTSLMASLANVTTEIEETKSRIYAC